MKTRECAACRAHETGECDEHFESFGIGADDDFGDDEFGDAGLGLPNVTVDGVARFR